MIFEFHCRDRVLSLSTRTGVFQVNVCLNKKAVALFSPQFALILIITCFHKQSQFACVIVALFSISVEYSVQ